MPNEHPSLLTTTTPGDRQTRGGSVLALHPALSPTMPVEESDADLGWDEWDRACILQDIAIDVPAGLSDELGL